MTVRLLCSTARGARFGLRYPWWSPIELRARQDARPRRRGASLARLQGCRATTTKGSFQTRSQFHALGQKPTIANDCLVAVSLRMVRVTDTAICLKVIGHLTRHDVTGRTLEGRAELLSWRQSDHRQDCVIRYARSISF